MEKNGKKFLVADKLFVLTLIFIHHRLHNVLCEEKLNFWRTRKVEFEELFFNKFFVDLHTRKF